MIHQDGALSAMQGIIEATPEEVCSLLYQSSISHRSTSAFYVGIQALIDCGGGRCFAVGRRDKLSLSLYAIYGDVH